MNTNHYNLGVGNHKRVSLLLVTAKGEPTIATPFNWLSDTNEEHF